MDVELFCQREAKVWYGALKFFHSTGCIFSAPGWSALFQIYVNHLWSLHLGFTLCFFPRLFLPYSHSLPHSPAHLLFLLNLCLPNWRYNPTKDTLTPPKKHANQNINHTRSMHVLSLLPSHFLLYLNIASHLCPSPELGEDVLATGTTALSSFLKHFFMYVCLFVQQDPAAGFAGSGTLSFQFSWPLNHYPNKSFCYY